MRKKDRKTKVRAGSRHGQVRARAIRSREVPRKRYHTFVLSESQVQKIASALFEQAMREDLGEKPHDYTLSAMKKISDRNAKAMRRRK